MFNVTVASPEQLPNICSHFRSRQTATFFQMIRAAGSHNDKPPPSASHLRLQSPRADAHYCSPQQRVVVVAVAVILLRGLEIIINVVNI